MNLEKLSADSAVPGLNRNIAYMELVVNVPTTVMKNYVNLTHPLLECQRFLEEEGRLLIDLRRTLLPKLISGELRIPDAEKFIEEVDV